MKDKNFEQLNSPNTSVKLLETARLLLQQPTVDDLHALGALWKDQKVREFLGGIIPGEQIEGKVLTILKHWEQHGFGQFAVHEKNTKKIIGICGLHHSDDGIEISYMLFPSFWGNGLATEATIASLNYGFNSLKLEQIIAITQEANRKSWRLLKKIGMRHIRNFSRFGATQRLYEITRTEWIIKYKS